MHLAFLIRSLIFLFSLGFLTGCSVTDRFLSSVEKIHRAFPPSAEVRVALEDARETFRNEPDALKTLEDRIRSQIQLRSLTCTQDLSIGRWDSVEEIKALPVNQQCLAEQDEILAATVGVARLGYLLTQPPLRPLSPLDGAPVIPNDASSFEAASQANILLVHGSHSGDFASVEITSGKTLATMPNIQGSYHRAPVSPNGRLVAVNKGNAGVVFLDMEHGNKLWETRKITELYAWLPDVRAALVRETKSSSPMLLDMDTGRLEAYAAGPSNLSWVTPTTEKGMVWLGSAREVFLVEHVRAKDGLHATVTKHFRLSKTQGVTSHTPTLVNQGETLFFVSNRDFGSLDLETGQETVWNVADFLANRYAKLSETTLLVESYASTGGVTMKTWVLDLAGRTLAPVDDSTMAASRNGLLMELPGRTGWIRRGYRNTTLGSTVKTGEPQSLGELSSNFKLEREIAKIDLMARREREKAERSQFISRRQGSDPGPLTAAPSAPAYRATDSATKSLFPAQAGLPQNSQVEAVGVYQGTGSSGGISPEGRKMGVVAVRVRRGSTPIILVLSSYEPVQWKISLDPGAQLAGVLLSGYYQSRVLGARSARVLQIGRYFAYQSGSSGYYALDREVRSWTGGQGIRAFQGRYEGGSYIVGG